MRIATNYKCGTDSERKSNLHTLERVREFQKTHFAVLSSYFMVTRKPALEMPEGK